MRADVRTAALLLANALALSAAAQGITPRVLLLWETRQSGAFSTTSLRQEIDLYLTRAVTDTISMRLSLGANHHDFASDGSGLTTRNARTVEVRPSGAFEGTFGPVSTTVNYALRRSRNDFADRRTDRDNEQFNGSLDWAPTRFVPGGSIRATRYRLADRGTTLDVVNDHVAGALLYAAGPLSLSVGQSMRVDRDAAGRYERRTDDRTAGLTFADSYFDSRVNISAAANGSTTRLDDRSSGNTRIPTRVPVSRAAWGIDDTPVDSTDRPPASYPALVDGVIGVSTGIDLGRDGASFQNVTFDIGRLSPVDEIQLVVRDERLAPVLSPGGIRWDVYTSNDGERWSLLVSDAPSRFDDARSQYDISFEQTDTRWIKVVNFGVAVQPVFVTEAYVLFHRTSASGEATSAFSSFDSSAAISVTPVRSVTLSWNSSAYRTTQDLGASLQSDVSDTLHLFSARHDPSTKFGYEARYELRDSRTERLTQTSDVVALSLRYAPRPQVSTTATCEARSEMLQELTIDGRYCSAQLSARVFPTLDVTVGGGLRQQDLSAGGSQQSKNAYANATARITRTLRMTLSGSANRSVSEDWTGPVPPPATDDRITADIEWSPGRALGIGGTFGWASGEFSSGLVQRYRLRWYPFGDGSVSLTTSYAQDIDPYTNSSSRRLLVSPRWQINARSALNLSYNSISTTGPQSLDSETIQASLIFGR